ncbi:tRNA pseudouridine synthase, partial [Caligus rogercresseyi]
PPAEGLMHTVLPEAEVVSIVVYFFQKKAKTGGPRDVDAMNACVALHDGYGHADHLADLMQHKALTPDSNDRKLKALLQKRLPHFEVRDKALT